MRCTFSNQETQSCVSIEQLNNIEMTFSFIATQLILLVCYPTQLLLCDKKQFLVQAEAKTRLAKLVDFQIDANLL